MNYLAHLFLAGNQPGIILGNFIADHVKGNDILQYTDDIRFGIRMHRAVDTFTDQHPIVKQSIERVRPSFRKYSGVVIDMYYDHFLSSCWNEYSPINLQQFTTQTYKVLMSYQSILPERSARLLYFMQKQNWLVSYGFPDGLRQAFTGMSKRTSFVSHIENAVDNLMVDYQNFKSDFELFFPDLMHYTDQNFGSALMSDNKKATG